LVGTSPISASSSSSGYLRLVNESL
jgi:hypothetical protein